MKRKTKRKSITLIIIWGLAILPSVAFAWTGKGSGTKEDPYQITNREELDEVAIQQNTDDNGGEFHFKLMNDIDLENKEFTPIDFSRAYIECFFDGNHKVISGLVINVENQHAGLFARFFCDGEIKDLGVRLGKKGITATSTTKETYNTGGIVGELDVYGGRKLIMTNCYVISDEDGNGIESNRTVGGIVGKIINIKDVGFSGTISINNCFSRCKLSGRIVGGIIGNFYCSGFRDFITNCYSDCELSGEIVGGILGELYSNGVCTVTNCYALGSINSTAIAGGIVGCCEASMGYSHGTYYGKIELSGCIALNLDGISCLGNEKGRITGTVITQYDRCIVSLENNYACAGIKINDSYVPQGSAGNINGEDLTPENFVGNNNGAFNKWDSSWLFDPENENLPILASINIERQQSIANMKRNDFIFIGVGNNDIEVDRTKIWSSEETLHIQSAETINLRILNLDGVLRNKLTISAGESCIQLPKGNYIVKLDNKYQKITVK